MQKVEKERASLTVDENEVSTESVQASADPVGSLHLTPVTRIEIKERNVFLLIAKAFGWHSWMDSLCLDSELKRWKTSWQSGPSLSLPSYIKNDP